MKQKNVIIILFAIVALVVGIGFAVSMKWSGSEAEEVAVEVRDEITGKRVIEQGEALKGQVRDIVNQQKTEQEAATQ